MTQKRVVKKKPLKKPGVSVAPASVGGRSPHAPSLFGTKPAPKRGGAAGYRPPSADSSGFGIGSVFLFLIALAFLGGVAVCFVPPSLSGVSGYPVASTTVDPGNLLRRLDDAISATYTDKKETTLTFSEEDLNTYLNKRLQKNQKGPFASWFQVEGVYCDLQPDAASVYLVRRVLGRPLVIFSSWAFVGDPDAQKFKCESSGIGLIKVAGKALQPITAPFERLRMACARELGALLDVSVDQVRIDDGKLVVHVR